MRRGLRLLIGTGAAFIVATGVALAASSPSVVTGDTSGVTLGSAVLHGTINPNGSATTYYFQWGITNGYGSASAVRPAGKGIKPVSVQATAGGLTPGTTYHYRLVASNHSGTSVGADRTFRSAGHPPAQVTTGPVTALNASGATLTGSINPNGQSTTWYFQWGNLNSLSQQTAPQSLKASNGTQGVSWPLQGLLNPGTLYQYRLVAVHQGSATTYGPTAIFMTYPSVRPYPRVSAFTAPRHRHRRRRPLIFTTFGRISGPSWLPAQYACAGEVAVRFFHGHRRVRQTFAAVNPSCAFSASTTFPRLPRGRNIHPPVHLRVVVTYLGTPYLARSRAPDERVTLG